MKISVNRRSTLCLLNMTLEENWISLDCKQESYTYDKTQNEFSASRLLVK